ncbi:hypothetical protein N431DRAFT_487767 [Stipitochalara longipes BDJ]|nr:hypothetical protein N431DRAFT_487767 [Stipitochalara longipes BDJ]
MMVIEDDTSDSGVKPGAANAANTAAGPSISENKDFGEDEKHGDDKEHENTRAREPQRANEPEEHGPSQREVNESLYSAAKHGDYRKVQELFHGKPYPEIDSANNEYGRTALHAAVLEDHPKIMELLVDNGAKSSDSMFRILLDYNLIDMAIHIVKKSQDKLPYLDSVDRTFLEECENNLLYVLGNPEGRVNDPVSRGNTPLHLASKLNHGGYVEWLLGKNALPSNTNSDNETAWEVAVKSSAYDAIGAFSFEEVKYQRNNYCPLSTSNLLFYINGADEDYEHSDWNSWHHIRGDSSKIMIYGYLRELAKRNDSRNWNSKEIIRMVIQNFREDYTINAFLSSREPSCVVDNMKISELPAIENGPQQFSFVSLVMPFFYSSSLAIIEKREENFDKLRKYHYCQCQDGKSLGLHFPLTMDEYCNPSLDSNILALRNKDQVVHRHLGKKANSRSVIIVPQAWIWKINDSVMTSLPVDTSFSDLIFNKMKHSWNLLERFSETSDRPGDIELAIGMFLSDLVDVFDRPSMAGLSEPVFTIFEKAIAKLSEEVNGYLESTLVEDININKEKRFLHDIDDIREELSMMRTVLFQQEEVWKEFANKTWPQYWPDGPDGRFKTPERPKDLDERTTPRNHQEIWSKIRRPQIQFPKFKRRIAKLDDDAERVERAIDRKLDLKAKHASINEAHSTAIMSAAVFGFTIVTIIFTPLSFMVSLFALPIDRFQKNQVPSVWDDQAGMYSTNYVGKWMATAELISVSLTLALMWFVVEYGLHVPLRKKIRNWANGLLERKSSDTVESRFGVNTPHASMTRANVRKCKDESQPEVLVAESSTDHSKPGHGSKKHQARITKWLRKRETQKQDEENNIEREK